MELTDSGMIEYKGNFEYYLEKTSPQQDDNSEDSERGSSGRASDTDRTIELVRASEADRQARKQKEAEERRRARRADEIEKRIHELEGQIADIEEAISDPAKAADFEWMHEQSELMASCEEEITGLYDEWIELQ